MPEFLNIELMNWEDFWDLVIRAAFNLAVVLILVRVLYYRITPRKDYLFTYILISVVVFFMIMLLENVGVEIGFCTGTVCHIRDAQVQDPADPHPGDDLSLPGDRHFCDQLTGQQEGQLCRTVAYQCCIVLITYLLEKVFLLKT